MRNPSQSLPSKATSSCCSKVGLKRGPWTPEEDQLLSNCIKENGEGRWRTLPKRAGLLRCGKSCRLRWMNYLRPTVKRGQIAPDEEDLILRLHRLLGNRWSLIAGRIPGRTDNEIKNYWNTHLSKKLISEGIDPRTQKPFKHESNGNANNKESSSKFIPPPSLIQDFTATFNIENGNNGSSTNEPEWYQPGTLGHGLVNLQTPAGAMIELQRNDGNEGFNYCSEDMFSSFLDSLINEDEFDWQNQHTTETVLSPESDSNPLLSSPSQALGHGHGWETAMVWPTLNQNNPNKVYDHVLELEAD